MHKKSSKARRHKGGENVTFKKEKNFENFYFFVKVKFHGLGRILPIDES
jgi:hypothetical protein